MYNLKRYTMRIRDPGPRYGEPAVPEEPFAESTVLRDLAGATDSEIPRILARYAAIRAWSMATAPVGTFAEEATDHALSAARAHLGDRCDAGAEEAALLEGALEAAARPRRTAEGGGLALLEAAARAAEAAGHIHGARALRETAHRARWRASGFPPSSLS